MQISRRKLLKSAAAGALPSFKARAAQQTIKIGVLNDQSGPYRDLGGMADVSCVRQAVQEFGPKGFDVEVVYADHQNKPDVGVGIARQWLDRDGVDMIADVPNSAVGLAVNEVCREKNKAYVNTGSGTTDLTGRMCAPTTVHWTYDTFMLAKSNGEAMVKQGGRHLVLHHRRLRLRKATAARHVTVHHAGRRPGFGSVGLPVPGHHGLRLVPGICPG